MKGLFYWGRLCEENYYTSYAGGGKGIIEGSAMQPGSKRQYLASCRKFRMGWKCVCMLLRRCCSNAVGVGESVVLSNIFVIGMIFCFNGRGGSRCERHNK